MIVEFDVVEGQMDRHVVESVNGVAEVVDVLVHLAGIGVTLDEQLPGLAGVPGNEDEAEVEDNVSG